MGFPADHPAIRQAFEKGLIEGATVVESGSKEKPELVAGAFAQIDGRAVWVLPILTVAESNSRDDWAKKSNRTRTARRIVSRAFGPRLDVVARFALAFHAGRTLGVVFTRLGGRKLDKGVNLPSALKATEDAVALMLGADDGAPNWDAKFEQQPGGKSGVRIELKLGGPLK